MARYSRLSEEEVIAIRDAYQAGAKQKDLAEKYGVHKQTISGICLGKQWTHLPGGGRRSNVVVVSPTTPEPIPTPSYRITGQPCLIAGFEGYRVFEDGTVQSRYRRGCGTMTDQWRTLKPTRNVRYGFLTVMLRSPESGIQRRKVHHLVLEAFAGPRPPGAEGRHLDDNPTNNHILNLVWGTHRQNMGDMARNGHSNRGVRNPRAKVTEGVVRAIRRDWLDGKKGREIADLYGVNEQLVSSIVTGKRWSHVR